MSASCPQLDGQFERLEAFVRPLLLSLEKRSERRLAHDYMLGLLGPSERKTVEPMVRAARGVERAPTQERRMTEMLVEGKWNALSLTLGGAERLLEASPDFSAYTLDDTSCLKQGRESVGVSNQYAGCVGGLANSQSIVTAGVASEYVSSLIAAQLFLPSSWCGPEAAERRARCRIPERVQHRTKAEIGLDIVREVALHGLPKKPWLCDSAYGDNTAFRHALTEAGETYVAGASMKLTMWPQGTVFATQPCPAAQGRRPVRLKAQQDARPITIAALAAGLPHVAWQNVVWRYGSRGVQKGRFAAVRVRPARGLNARNIHGTIHESDLQPEQWLLIHWPEGKKAATKAWLSNLADDIDIVTLVALARLRWRIERDHEEGKGLLGFDHYEGRSWPGLHHHLALVILAEQFLASERLRDSAAATAAFPPSGPADAYAAYLAHA